MCGLAVHGLTPPTTQRSSSSATRSEGQSLPQFFVRVFLDIQTGQPPGSRHENLPSHDAPGGFLFDVAYIDDFPFWRHTRNSFGCSIMISAIPRRRNITFQVIPTLMATRA